MSEPSATLVRTSNPEKPAWTAIGFAIQVLPSARVTKARREVGAAVCVKARGMKEAWHLATSHADRAGAEARGALLEAVHDRGELPRPEEPALRDRALRHRIGVPERRDRFLLMSAIAIALLTMLGAAGEAIGIDRHLKTNTVKRRTLSLLNQGLFHYAAFPKMKQDRAVALMAKFDEMIRAQRVFREVFGLM